MANSKTIYICIGIIAATIIAAITGAYLSFLPKYYRLYNYGSKTNGTVILKEQENHWFITAEYEVNNKKFKAVGHAEDFGKSFFTVALNDKIPVSYYPENPEESCLGNPDEQLRASALGTGFVATFPIIFLLVYLIKKKD